MAEMTKVIPGKEACPGNLIWSAFGASYPDTVCSSALEWPDGYRAWGLCDADDDFREKGVPCPFCDAASFLESHWGSPEEYAVLWADTEAPVPDGAEVHFHDAEALWFSATDTDGTERRAIIRTVDIGEEG